MGDISVKIERRELRILRQETGQFGRRFPIGPVCWPHFDLLWIHEGEVTLKIGTESETVRLTAPDGHLIFPNVPFSGRSVNGKANASICHFQGGPFEDERTTMLFAKPDPRDTLHVQNLLRLSLAYAEREAEHLVRARLLGAILDCFVEGRIPKEYPNRITQAWHDAANRLSTIRDLTDVADFLGLSESAFRSLHRKSFGNSAGSHLRELRLSLAERLLSTTGDSISEISRKIGYSYPESFSNAFRASRGQTPRQFRNWSRKFS
ncbi:MAG: helix-turn-helix transcriptional regulator [Rhodobacteraceae bacterium]|nr:helix-turn-helix transcriptional regulator [Paracoccaceae bacterium]